ncbi:hypothetical protein BDV98DRAFT_346031 [Pterulicium gracile]|uniref:Uncharacterized protein n=1 Tax=Pterulicium gracile TaxID=1884261 RepID=A0A5C3Q6V5_9AGAR|nr:hypothetical protein BDV98DRAFT_346031 [Pterula gracilis]
MYLTEFDNNDGWAIIDVTEPADVGICFLAGGAPSRPISAEAYLRTGRTQSKYMKELIQSLNAVRQLTKDDLAEAWPRLFDQPQPGPESSQEVDEALDQVPETNFLPSLVSIAT